MERKLSLIKNTEKLQEKRIFPRFPIGLMIFKDQKNALTFEVKDISLNGMQIELKDGVNAYRNLESICGELHWRGDEISLNGEVQWASGQRLGIRFQNDEHADSLKGLLSLDNVVSHIKAVHENPLSLDLPHGLKYWLKADGVLDFFVWELPLSGISHFQILFMENFIEWNEGVGLRTGRIINQRNIETPLNFQDELIIENDTEIQADRIHLAKRILSSINPIHINHSDREFLLYKIKI